MKQIYKSLLISAAFSGILSFSSAMKPETLEPCSCTTMTLLKRIPVSVDVNEVTYDDVLPRIHALDLTLNKQVSGAEGNNLVLYKDELFEKPRIWKKELVDIFTEELHFGKNSSFQEYKDKLSPSYRKKREILKQVRTKYDEYVRTTLPRLRIESVLIPKNASTYDKILARIIEADVALQAAQEATELTPCHPGKFNNLKRILDSNSERLGQEKETALNIFTRELYFFVEYFTVESLFSELDQKAQQTLDQKTRQALREERLALKGTVGIKSKEALSKFSAKKETTLKEVYNTCSEIIREISDFRYRHYAPMFFCTSGRLDLRELSNLTYDNAFAHLNEVGFALQVVSREKTMEADCEIEKTSFYKMTNSLCDLFEDEMLHAKEGEEAQKFFIEKQNLLRETCNRCWKLFESILSNHYIHLP